MAPVTATLTGIEPQVIDDEELLAFLSRLRAFDVSSSVKDNEEADSSVPTLVDVDGLVAELERIPKWRFQELVSVSFSLENASFPRHFVIHFF